MRHLRTVVFVSLFASIGAGCAAIAGLGDLEEVACDAGCDGGVADVTSGNDATGDSIAPDSPGLHDSSGDALGGDSSGDDASSPDTSADSSAPDGTDADADAMNSDEPDAFEGPDVDSGCGPLNSTSNCGACGVMCGGQHAASVACANFDSCNYTCSAGFANCDQTGRNTNGCECATPACCGAACETIHSNGLVPANDFYDCTALNTYNGTQANEACIAYVGQANAGDCLGFTCIDSSDASVGDMLCSTGAAFNCNCWGYSGMIMGEVQAGAGAGIAPNYNACNCPAAAIPWH